MTAKTTLRFFLSSAIGAFLMLPYGSFARNAGPATQDASPPAAAASEPMGPSALSLVVCDPPTFENCHRVEGVTRPRMIHSETPAYPAEARRLGLAGVSVVSLVIDPQGIPRNVSTARSIAESVPASQREVAIEMDKSAVECVKRYRFVAATLNGEPVATQVKVKMNFHRTMAK